MTTRTVVCPECGADVPYGRLSCVACGTLLASVAGATRRAIGSAPSRDADASAANDAQAGSPAAIAGGADLVDGGSSASGIADERPIPPVLRDWTGPLPAAMADPVPAPVAPAGSSIPRPRWVREPQAGDIGSGSPVVAGGAAGDVIGGATPRTDPLVATSSPYVPATSIGRAVPDPDDAPIGTSQPSLPGAYVAPSIVPTAASTINGRPATATAIAAASIADGTLATVPATPRPNRWFSAPDPAADPSSTPGKAGLFSDLPFRSPRDVAGWVVAIGSLVGALAFILPVAWSENGVMGSQYNPTLTGTWGLANPADLIPMGVALALLLMTVIPSRIPVSVRGVILPVLVGGWFVGIVWSYATGSYGLGWGVDALGIGGVLLAAGGAIAHVRGSAAAPSDVAPDRPSA